MTKNNIEPLKKLRQRMRDLSSLLEREPFILIPGKGDVLISGKAEDLILRQKINKNDLLNWLRMEYSPICNSCCNIGIAVMKFPDKSNDILAILREEHLPAKKINLTTKEREILGCLTNGFRNKEIASSLNISAETVNAHLDNIYSKLGVSNRLAAAFAGMKNGLAIFKAGSLPKNHNLIS